MLGYKTAVFIYDMHPKNAEILIQDFLKITDVYALKKLIMFSKRLKVMMSADQIQNNHKIMT